MAKSRKVILWASAALIIGALLFPPYWDPHWDDQGRFTNVTTKWEFNRRLRNEIREARTFFHYKNKLVFGLREEEYPTRLDILWMEILMVVVLSGATLLIIRKQ